MPSSLGVRERGDFPGRQTFRAGQEVFFWGAEKNRVAQAPSPVRVQPSRGQLCHTGLCTQARVKNVEPLHRPPASRVNESLGSNVTLFPLPTNFIIWKASLVWSTVNRQ